MGWPLEVRDGVFGPNAPTAGPPPYAVYELRPTTVFGLPGIRHGAGSRERGCLQPNPLAIPGCRPAEVIAFAITAYAVLTTRRLAQRSLDPC
jgi:hypothetical protein